MLIALAVVWLLPAAIHSAAFAARLWVFTDGVVLSAHLAVCRSTGRAAKLPDDPGCLGWLLRGLIVLIRILFNTTWGLSIFDANSVETSRARSCWPTRNGLFVSTIP
jgi:hypothetical protein